MLTGRRAFERPTIAETLSAIIREEPPVIAQLNPAVPPPVRWIVARCLAKDTDERYALWSLIAMAVWRNLGFSMVVFLAGLQTIPRDLYEAAEVDGAGRWDRFRRITVPMLRPTLLFAAVITGIGYVQFFEEPFVMTRGGPLDSTVSVAMHAYDQFSFGNYGYTAAISYVLFLAVALLTFIQFRVFGRETT